MERCPKCGSVKKSEISPEDVEKMGVDQLIKITKEQIKMMSLDTLNAVRERAFDLTPYSSEVSKFWDNMYEVAMSREDYRRDQEAWEEEARN